MPLADPRLNKKIELFNYNGAQITNFEMKSSSLAGLFGYDGTSSNDHVCCIIAGGLIPVTLIKRFNTDYNKN